MGYDRITQIPAGATVTNIEPLTGYESEKETAASTICSVVYEHRGEEYRTSVVGKNVEELKERLTEVGGNTNKDPKSPELKETNDYLEGGPASD